MDIRSPIPLALTPTLLGLCGCPLILGGPDLSNVDGPEPLDTSAPTSPSTTPDSAAPTTEADAPVVIAFSVDPMLDRVGFGIVMTDADGDLLGGRVEVWDNDGAEVLSWSIPQELQRFEPEGESFASLDRRVLDCEVDYVQTWTVAVTDLAGNRSAEVQTAVRVTAHGTLPPVPVVDLGEVELPLVACVTFSGETQQQLRQDEKNVLLAPGDGGRTLFQLGWWDPPGLDLDLFVYDEEGLQLGIGYSPVGFEQFTVDVPAGTTLRVESRFYGVPPPLAPPYEGTLLIRPD